MKESIGFLLVVLLIAAYYNFFAPASTDAMLSVEGVMGEGVSFESSGGDMSSYYAKVRISGDLRKYIIGGCPYAVTNVAKAKALIAGDSVSLLVFKSFAIFEPNYSVYAFSSHRLGPIISEAAVSNCNANTSKKWIYIAAIIVLFLFLKFRVMPLFKRFPQ